MLTAGTIVQSLSPRHFPSIGLQIGSAVSG
jgi:hypothetical protein